MLTENIDNNVNSALTITDSYSEKIQFAFQFEQTWRESETVLYNCDSPEEIITKMLIATVIFYDGDWLGIMEADLTMKIWSTLWWYNRKTDGMTSNSFGDLQGGEYLVRWIDALMHGIPMVIHDINDIEDSSPQEYEFMKQNGVQSIIAVPFWKRPTGFLIVRNPKRYLNRSSLLQMMAFVAVSSVNEKRLMDSAKLMMVPESIRSSNDIIINVFHAECLTYAAIDSWSNKLFVLCRHTSGNSIRQCYCGV